MLERVAGLSADAPDFVNLRKAGRAAIVVPSLTAFGIFVLHDDALTMYAVFASFVALVFSDYGGPPRRMAAAYLTSIVAGALAIVLGAALSSFPAAGAVGMFAVAFSVTFATAFGGYMALHVAPVALGYSLSVLAPLDQLALGDRIAGWALGGGVALVAAIVLWPIERRTGIRQAAAALAGDLAGALASLEQPGAAAERLAEARAGATLLETRLSSPLRPYGPASRDVAMVHLVEHLHQGVDLATEVVAGRRTAVVDPGLLEEVTSALERTRATLAGDVPADAALRALRPLDAARAAGRDRVEAEARRESSDGRATLDAMLASIPLLALSHVTLWIEDEAARVMGAAGEEPPELTTAPEVSRSGREGLRSIAGRARAFAASELDPEGVILRNSIRAGTALAAAVAIAEILPVAHGFWIVLATLMVLRSGASSTYATALEAVGGTVAGFVVAALIALAAGDSETALWLLYPFAVGFAAYSPGAIHFVVGQAAFAVMVVILFGLTDVPGLQTAVVRVETLTVGAVTATLLSLVLWPRGARAALARTVAEVYAAAAEGARLFVTEPGERRAAAEERLTEADRRAEAAFVAALAEHKEPVDMASWMAVFRPPALARALLVGLVPSLGSPSPACREAVDAAGRAAETAAERLSAVAAQLDATHPTASDPAVVASSAGAAPVVGPDLERCVDASDGMGDALAVVAWSALISRLSRDIDRVRPALDAVAASSAPHAWLHHSVAPR